MKKETKSTKKTTRKEYTATLKNLGVLYTAIGTTVREALEKLEVKNPKGISILTIEHGDKRQERILNPLKAMNLFSRGRIQREIGLKHTAMLFDL